MLSRIHQLKIIRLKKEKEYCAISLDFMQMFISLSLLTIDTCTRYNAGRSIGTGCCVTSQKCPHNDNLGYKTRTKIFPTYQSNEIDPATCISSTQHTHLFSSFCNPLFPFISCTFKIKALNRIGKY